MPSLYWLLFCSRKSLERIWLKTANQTSLDCKLSSLDRAWRVRLTRVDIRRIFPAVIAVCPHQTLMPSRASPLASDGAVARAFILDCSIVVITTKRAWIGGPRPLIEWLGVAASRACSHKAKSGCSGLPKASEA